MIEVTLWPIVAAGVVSLLIGVVWYHPKVFGGVWMRLANLSPEAVERGKRRMPLIAAAVALASMFIAYVMNYFGIAWGVYDVQNAVQLGLWCWLGFVAPTMLGMVLWEQRSFMLYLINAFYWLVSFIAMAVTILFVGMYI